MAFKVVELTLTDEQLSTIRAAVDPLRDFALIGQPHIRGSRSGEFKVYVCTSGQYALLDAAVKQAYKLESYR